jgi:hypothetical protein
MEDQQDGEHVGCKRRIEDELREYRARYIATHDELSDKLKGHEQNDPEKVKLREDCIAEGCAVISEQSHGVTGDRVARPKMPN